MDAYLQNVLEIANSLGASDIHLSSGEPIFFRVAGALRPASSFDTEPPLSNNSIPEVADEPWLAKIASELLTESQTHCLNDRGSADGAFSFEGYRFRFNVFRRSGNICFALRQLADQIPSLDQLGIDRRLYDVCHLKDGLILVAGPTGSGKSTTIASLIDRINQQRECHIITVEDPVEFLHSSTKSLVNQRQIGPDVGSYHQALLDAMRQDPDVILVGELRDIDTIRTAITAAETGHLVFATVHAGDTKTAVERLVSAYSADEQNLAQRLVATVLRSVVVQHLLPRQEKPGEEKASDRVNVQSGIAGSKTRVLATERVHVTSGIANLIASGNLSQLASIIQTSGEKGMWTLDESLALLLRQGSISEKTARSLARQPEMLGKLARIR